MKTVHQSVTKMWQNYLASIGDTVNNTTKKYSAWHFCNNEKDANELAQLVLYGTKSATASLYESYEYEKEALPTIGDHSIILDWHGISQCIIQTTKINITKFKDVTEEFAALEGEGDKSLKYWREGHWIFFSEEMIEMGHKASEDMLVLCQEFQVLFK